MYNQKRISVVKKIVPIVLTMVCHSLFCQDTHLSQFWLSPININPSTTGFIDGNLRANLYYRTQWRAISEPYQTTGITVDLPVKKRVSKQDIFSLGVNVEYDIAGDSKYTTAQGLFSFAYAHALNRKNNHFIMAGVSLGAVQRSWDYSQLKFDEQYQNGIYNTDIPLSEIFPTKGFMFFDCGIGVSWFYQPTINNKMQAGISLYHLNMPSISLYKEDNVRLPIKTNLFFHAEFALNEHNILQPSVFYAMQARYQEFQFGLAHVYLFPFDSQGFINRFNIGLYYRWNDALYLSVGGEWRRITLGICYDFNISKLVKASPVRGSFELNLSYIFKTERAPRQKRIPCYLF